jgi:DNA replication protein DnaC
MNMTEIERALRELRLSGIADTLSTRVMQAQAAQQPFLETLAAMLQDELDRRRSRLMERRFKRSGLAERLTLADFDWRFNPKLPRNACFELHTLKFIGEGANALIVGKPGTGKSHVAKAVAYLATLQGYDVRTWRLTPSSPATGWPARPNRPNSSRAGSSQTCWSSMTCSWPGALPT